MEDKGACLPGVLLRSEVHDEMKSKSHVTLLKVMNRKHSPKYEHRGCCNWCHRETRLCLLFFQSEGCETKAALISDLEKHEVKLNEWQHVFSEGGASL